MTRNGKRTVALALICVLAVLMSLCTICAIGASSSQAQAAISLPTLKTEIENVIAMRDSDQYFQSAYETVKAKYDLLTEAQKNTFDSGIYNMTYDGQANKKPSLCLSSLATDIANHNVAITSATNSIKDVATDLKKVTNQYEILSNSALFEKIRDALDAYNNLTAIQKRWFRDEGDLNYIKNKYVSLVCSLDAFYNSVEDVNFYIDTHDVPDLTVKFLGKTDFGSDDYALLRDSATEGKFTIAKNCYNNLDASLVTALQNKTAMPKVIMQYVYSPVSKRTLDTTYATTNSYYTYDSGTDTYTLTEKRVSKDELLDGDYYELNIVDYIHPSYENAYTDYITTDTAINTLKASADTVLADLKAIGSSRPTTSAQFAPFIGVVDTARKSYDAVAQYNTAGYIKGVREIAESIVIAGGTKNLVENLKDAEGYLYIDYVDADSVKKEYFLDVLFQFQEYINALDAGIMNDNLKVRLTEKVQDSLVKAEKVIQKVEYPVTGSATEIFKNKLQTEYGTILSLAQTVRTELDARITLAEDWILDMEEIYIGSESFSEAMAEEMAQENGGAAADTARKTDSLSTPALSTLVPGNSKIDEYLAYPQDVKNYIKKTSVLMNSNGVDAGLNLISEEIPNLLAGKLYFLEYFRKAANKLEDSVFNTADYFVPVTVFESTINNGFYYLQDGKYIRMDIQPLGQDSLDLAISQHTTIYTPLSVYTETTKPTYIEAEKFDATKKYYKIESTLYVLLNPQPVSQSTLDSAILANGVVYTQPMYYVVNGTRADGTLNFEPAYRQPSTMGDFGGPTKYYTKRKGTLRNAYTVESKLQAYALECIYRSAPEDFKKLISQESLDQIQAVIQAEGGLKEYTLADLLAYIKELEEQLAALHAPELVGLDDLYDRVAALETSVSTLIGTVSTLTSTVSNLEGKVTTLEEIASSLDWKDENGATADGAYTTLIRNAIKNAIDALSAEGGAIYNLNDSFTTLNNALLQAQTDLADLTTRVENLETQYTSLSGSITTLTNNLSTESQEREEADEALKNLIKNSIDEAKQDLINNNIKDALDKIDNLTTQITNLKNELDALTIRVELLEKKGYMTKDEVDQAISDAMAAITGWDPEKATELTREINENLETMDTRVEVLEYKVEALTIILICIFSLIAVIMLIMGITFYFVFKKMKVKKY